MLMRMACIFLEVHTSDLRTGRFQHHGQLSCRATQPAGNIPFTDQLKFQGGPDADTPKMSCYRTLDSSGRSLPEAQLSHKVDRELALKMYRSMASVQTVDTIFYEAQRQVCCSLLQGEDWAAAWPMCNMIPTFRGRQVHPAQPLALLCCPPQCGALQA